MHAGPASLGLHAPEEFSPLGEAWAKVSASVGAPVVFKAWTVFGRRGRLHRPQVPESEKDGEGIDAPPRRCFLRRD